MRSKNVASEGDAERVIPGSSGELEVVTPCSTTSQMCFCVSNGKAAEPSGAKHFDKSSCTNADSLFCDGANSLTKDFKACICRTGKSS